MIDIQPFDSGSRRYAPWLALLAFLFLLSSYALGSTDSHVGNALAGLSLYSAFGSAAAATIYWFDRPTWFGKRDDGHRPLVATLLLGGYFVLVLVARFLQRTVTREEAWNEVSSGLFVGRQSDEVPSHSTVVIDLTAELVDPLSLRQRQGYLCGLVLDGTAPTPELLVALSEHVGDDDVAYVHCAAGHGRSATLAALILIRRELARDAEEAEKLMQQSRPKVHLTRHQKAAVAAALQMLRTK